MRTQLKEKIQVALKVFVERKGSQQKAAAALDGVSPALISQQLANNWKDISEQMWNKLCKQLRVCRVEWTLAETGPYKFMKEVLSEAQKHSKVMAIVMPPGSGKTATARAFCDEKGDRYHIECASYMTQQSFLRDILSAMGKDKGGSAPMLIDRIVRELEKKEAPLLILDEWEKMTPKVKYFFITLYNKLENKCGIVLIGTPKLKTIIEDGVNRDTIGFPEIYSRLNRTFLEPKPLRAKDIMLVCQANGITNTADQQMIVNECGGDLRSVNLKVLAMKQLKQQELQELQEEAA